MREKGRLGALSLDQKRRDRSVEYCGRWVAALWIEKRLIIGSRSGGDKET
jgi:hypothetical protein